MFDLNIVLLANPKECPNIDILVISLQEIGEHFIRLRFVVLQVLLATYMKELSSILTK